MFTISELAGDAYECFEYLQRGEDDTIVKTKDDAPEWVGDLVRTAHGTDFLPDDWRYEAIHSALGAISDSGAETNDDLDDLAHEWADGNVDVYTGSRLKWLASNLNRPGYVDRAVDELGGEGMDTTERIGLGQYVESIEVFESVRRSLVEHLETLELEAEVEDES